MQVVPAAMLDLHSTRFKKVPPLLLDSLVEEPERRSVPDHLLESKIYSTLGRNEFVQASPAVLHFGGYELGKRHHQILKLINVSRRTMNLHILPPQTKHFSITYRKAQRLGPGLALTVNIYFLPDEWRYYYDCIRVHCQDDETLLVPVHGYAAMNAVHLPPAISFHGVSLGQSKHHVLPLRGRCPVAFQFRIVCSQSRQAFTVSPSSGVIPANGQVEVTVTFTPSDYGTARMRMDLLISELNAKPYNCVFTGTCTPGTPQISENITQTLISSPKRCEDPVTGVMLPVSRKKRHLQTLRQNASKVIEYQNLRSPVTLSSSHSVAAVLIQQPGRLKARDVREDLTGRTMNTRPVKEMLFEQKVQQNVVEEEANQLRWQIHVGSEPLCPALRQKISEERRTAAAECKIDMGSAVLERQYKRDAVCFSSWYILRTMDQRPVYQPQFDLYMNNLWADRHRTLKRFQQAARKVLIRRRIDGRLFLLEKLVDIMKPAHNGKEPPQGRVPDAGDLQVLTDCVSGLEFPYSPEEHHQESPSGLTVPKPADVLLKEVLPYYNLKVPQHYQVMGYRRLGALMASTSYKAPCLARALRTGAEDELMPVAVTRKAPTVAGPLTVLQPETPAPRIPCFAPPEPLLSPPDFPALHVFNPAPGLVDLKRPLSCSETDMEHHFCPLPKYPVLSAPAGASGTAQRRFLSREEVVRGMMTWRKVSTITMALPSAAAGRTRWCDPFNVDLLPLEAPPALSDLPEEDEDNVVTRETEEKEVKVSLTPSMLRLQFPLRHTSPLDPKVDLIEPRAESAAPDEQSHLSEKVHEHLRRMKILSCNSALILI